MKDMNGTTPDIAVVIQVPVDQRALEPRFNDAIRNATNAKPCTRATQEGKGGGHATITIDGKDCDWQMTETDGQTNEANCLRDDKEFKLEDPLTHQDLKYDAERSGDTLTLSPQNDQAEKVGVMVLTKTTEK